MPSVRLRFFEPISDDQLKKFKRIGIAESMHHATGDEIAWRATHSGKINIYIYNTPALPFCRHFFRLNSLDGHSCNAMPIY